MPPTIQPRAGSFILTTQGLASPTQMVRAIRQTVQMPGTRDTLRAELRQLGALLTGAGYREQGLTVEMMAGRLTGSAADLSFVVSITQAIEHLTPAQWQNFRQLTSPSVVVVTGVFRRPKPAPAAKPAEAPAVEKSATKAIELRTGNGVSNPPDEIDRALTNMREALNHISSSAALVKRLIPHLGAIISGDIEGISKSAREDIIRFVALSPGHAAAYGDRLLTEILLNGMSGSKKLELEISLDGLEPMAIQEVAEEGVGPERRRITFGSAEDNYWKLLGLQQTSLDPTLKSLAEAHPALFGTDAMRTLIETGRLARSMRDKDGSRLERAEEVVAISGDSPVTDLFLRHSAGRLVQVTVPADIKPAGNAWTKPLETYLGSPEFQVDRARDDIPATNTPFNIRAVFEEMELTVDGSITGLQTHDMLLAEASRARDLHNNGHFLEARRTIILVRAMAVKASSVNLEGEGLGHFSNIVKLVRGFLNENKLAEAETLVDFGYSLANKIRNSIREIDSLCADIRIIGDVKSMREYRKLAMQLLRIGDMEKLSTLNRDISEQIGGILTEENAQFRRGAGVRANAAVAYALAVYQYAQRNQLTGGQLGRILPASSLLSPSGGPANMPHAARLLVNAGVHIDAAMLPERAEGSEEKETGE